MERKDDEQDMEARARTRHPLVVFAWYHVIGDSADRDDGYQGIALSCDISQGGVGMRTASALPVHRRIFLEVASQIGSISVVGTVVYSRPQEDGSHRIGVRVEIVPPTDRERLGRLTR